MASPPRCRIRLFSARASWRDHQPAEGRSNGAICWASAQSILGDWWQVDLGEIRTIEGIGLRGRASGDDQRVTSYTVSVSDDGHTWRVLRQSGTSPQDKAMVFPGAFIDRNTEVIANMPTSTTARFVRIYPQTWNQFMSMRCEIYVSEVRPIVKTDPDYDSF